jgi:hypothetical protein
MASGDRWACFSAKDGWAAITEMAPKDEAFVGFAPHMPPTVIWSRCAMWSEINYQS